MILPIAVQRACGRAMCLSCVALIISGCAKQRETGVVVTGMQTRAVLAAADARQISLFGDLPDSRTTTYFSRTAMSLRQHSFTEVGSDFDADIDSQGQRMVFASTRHNVQPDLYIKSIDGVAVTQLTSDPASDSQPVFSPDDTRVAFASNRSGNWDIWVVNVSGGPPVQVTRGMAEETSPSWSPDGTRLVFCSLPSEGGQWELWTVDAEAGGTTRFIGYGLFPEWSPVGDTIVFQRARERGSRWFGIWTLTLLEGEPRYPTEIAAGASRAMIAPTWDRDGTRIAFASMSNVSSSTEHAPTPDAMDRSEAPFDIWIMDADGRGKRRLTDGHTTNYAPVFSPDGRIYFTSNRSGNENLWSVLPGNRPGRFPGRDAVTGRSREMKAVPNAGTAGISTAALVKDGS